MPSCQFEGKMRVSSSTVVIRIHQREGQSCSEETFKVLLVLVKLAVTPVLNQIHSGTDGVCDEGL